MKKIIVSAFVLSMMFSLTAQEQGKYEINNSRVNTKDSDFGTAYYGENQVVFATPKKGAFMIKKKQKENGQAFLDLYVGQVGSNGEILKAKRLSKKLNNKYHEAGLVFTNDGKTIYFTANDPNLKRSDKKLLRIYRATLNGSEWENIEDLSINNDTYSVGHPALSPDNKTLYFVSDMPGGTGETDIYKVSISDDGTLGSPEHLGSKINTSAKEMFPFVTKDNILYFASSGHQGQGGLDVFVSKIESDGYMTTPLNLGDQINSPLDDFAYIIDDATGKGFFSSNREGGIGDDDI